MASGSSVGSDAFALLSLLVISLAVLLLLRHFLPLRTTPAYLLTPVFLALALPVSIVLLVPIDLASSSGTDDEASRGIWLPQKVVLIAWRIAYWLTFALTWYVHRRFEAVSHGSGIDVAQGYLTSPGRIHRFGVSDTKGPPPILSAFECALPAHCSWFWRSWACLCVLRKRVPVDISQITGYGIGILLGFDAGNISYGPRLGCGTTKTFPQCECQWQVEEDTGTGAEDT